MAGDEHEPERGRRIQQRAADQERPVAEASGEATGEVVVEAGLNEPDPQVVAFVKWAEREVKNPAVRGVRVESLESGRPEMRQTLAREQGQSSV